MLIKNIISSISVAVLCTGLCFAQTFERKGNVVTYRNNKFLYSPAGKTDTVTITDPITNQQMVKITTVEPKPIKMNGQKIYYTEEMSMVPIPDGGDGAPERGILKALQKDCNKLPDGKYYLDVFNVITDTKGKVVYYEYGGLLSHANKVKISDTITNAVDSKIDSLMINMSPFKPGRANGKNVIAHTDIYMSFIPITVKKHKATFGKK